MKFSLFESVSTLPLHRIVSCGAHHSHVQPKTKKKKLISIQLTLYVGYHWCSIRWSKPRQRRLWWWEPLPWSTIRSRQYRRFRYACNDFSNLGYRTSLCHHSSRPQPIFLLQIPFCTYYRYRRSTLVLPHWPCCCCIFTKLDYLWCSTQSRTFHCEGTCSHYRTSLKNMDSYPTLTNIFFSRLWYIFLSHRPFAQSANLLRLPLVLDLHMQPTSSQSRECTTTKHTILAVRSLLSFLASNIPLNNCQYRSMVYCYVHAAHWFLNRWCRTTVLGRTSGYDLAYQSCRLRSFQHFAFSAIRGYWNSRRSQSREVFRLRLCWILFVVWVSVVLMSFYPNPHTSDRFKDFFPGYICQTLSSAQLPPYSHDL